MLKTLNKIQIQLMNSIKLFALLFVLIFAVTAHATKNQTLSLQAPLISLGHISIDSLSFSEVIFGIDLSVLNTNTHDLIVEELHYKLFINQTAIKEETVQRRERFPAKTTRTLDLSVPLALNETALQVVAALNSQTKVTYSIEGYIRLQGHKAVFPFLHQDDLKLR